MLKSAAIFVFLSIFVVNLAYGQEEQPTISVAQTVQQKVISKEQVEQELSRLFGLIKQDPKNLDINFAYAQLATKLERYDEALAAYERMLLVRDDLLRVKLEMAVVYMKIGNSTNAESLFIEVMDTNPPKQVEKNIRHLMAQLGKMKKLHQFSGSLTMGYQTDSNANTAPTSGIQLVGGYSFPLDITSLETTDDQIFTALTLRHTYTLPGRSNNFWQTEGIYYKNDNSSLNDSEVTLKSIKTGPTFTFPEWKSRASLRVQYTDTNLDHRDYQQAFRQEVSWYQEVHPQLSLEVIASRDWKRHHNSPSSSLYTLRNGNAWEYKAILTYAMSQKEMALLTYTNHRELTKKDYYNYTGNTLDFQYMRQLPYKLSMILGMGFVQNEYSAADPSVDPDNAKKDGERNYNITFSRPLMKGLSLVAGYTYKDMDSNLESSEYENERWSLSLTKQF